MTAEMDNVRKVVLVGHCGPDAGALKSAVQHAVPEAAVDVVNDATTLQGYIRPDCVLLVNRQLDGSFNTTRGVELIRDVAAREAAPVAMLVSNFGDAQQAAVQAGARPGFGKRAMYDDATRECLRDAIVG